MGSVASTVTRVGADMMTFGSYELMRKLAPPGGTPDEMVGRMYQSPADPGTPPRAPDAADAAVRNARLMERRKQLGLDGRMSTFLTTATDAQPSSTSTAGQATLLGG